MAKGWTLEALAKTAAGRNSNNAGVLGTSAISAATGKVKRVTVKKIVDIPKSYIDADRAIIITPQPDRRLHPNGRAHHHAKARLTAACKADAAWRVREALGTRSKPLWAAAHLTIHVYLTTRRGADRDNAVGWCKGIIDGICKEEFGGLMKDDAGLMTPVVVIDTDRMCPRIELVFKRVKGSEGENQ